jgi:hypothetical protein
MDFGNAVTISGNSVITTMKTIMITQKGQA